MDHLPTAVKERVESCERKLKELSSLVLRERKPQAGAYGLFHYNSHTLSRVRDCARILDRLYLQRAQLTAANIEQERMRPKQWPRNTPYAEPVAKVMKRAHELTELMELDMEALYMFGMTLLDQWSLQALAIANVKTKRDHPFSELVKHLEEQPGSPLRPFWTAFKGAILWLHYQVRFYRNRFIIHPTRPWQRGTTAAMYGDDFNLFIPTPPGWLDDKALDGEITKLMRLAPKHIARGSADHWEKAPARLIEILFDNIARFEAKDREKVAELFGKKGGTTPTFQTIGSRLLEFIDDGTTELAAVAHANMEHIDLEPPHRTSDRMWKERD